MLVRSATKYGCDGCKDKKSSQGRLLGDPKEMLRELWLGDPKEMLREPWLLCEAVDAANDSIDLNN